MRLTVLILHTLTTTTIIFLFIVVHVYLDDPLVLVDFVDMGSRYLGSDPLTAISRDTKPIPLETFDM